MNRETFDSHLDAWRKLDIGSVSIVYLPDCNGCGPYAYGTLRVEGDSARANIAKLLKIAEDSTGYLTVITGTLEAYPLASISISCHELTDDELSTIAVQGAA